MGITFHADGRVTGSSASNFGASGQILQSVTKMGTGCYNMTNTSWGTELSTDFRVTLPTVRSADTKILILFSTTDGHTVLICNRIAEVLSMTGSVTITSLEDCSELEIKSADKVLVGASIRYGKHKKNLFSFSKKYKSILDSKENAFFSVNAVARKPEKSDPETNPYLIKFMKQSAWQPKKLGVFAGKIDYPKYKFFDKHMIRLIMWITNGPTDINESFEFTDWSKVDDFAKGIFN